MATTEPIYSPFFGVMGAASAIIFSGKFCSVFEMKRKKAKWKNLAIFYLFKFSHEIETIYF